MDAISQTTFSRAFVNENCFILIKCSLKYVRNGPIDNNPALVQIMAWRRSGDKPSSEPMISLPTHICITRPQWVNQCPNPNAGLADMSLWKESKVDSTVHPKIWSLSLWALFCRYMMTLIITWWWITYPCLNCDASLVTTRMQNVCMYSMRETFSPWFTDTLLKRVTFGNYWTNISKYILSCA